jgi:hypothetical protein
MLIAGCIVAVIGIVWFFRTRRLRSLWRRAHHDVTRVAVLLELEERVRELESEQPSRQAG